MRSKMSAGLIITALVLGLSVIQVKAAGITVGGGIDAVYPLVLDGGHEMEGMESIWEYHLEEKSFSLTHVHPKVTMELSDKVSGELVACFSEHHPASIWAAQMEYTPIIPEGFGDNPITIRAGRFFIPFGFFNENYVNPGEMKTISRPLMYVDHEQEDMELHGGPRPIFMSPYFDTGVMLYGSKWLRGNKDQLWYGVYGVNGLYYNEDAYEGMSRIDIDWETEHIPHEDPSKNNKQIGGRIAYSVGELFTVGASYLTGKYDAESRLENTVYGGDIHVALGKANLRFEYAENPVEWIDKSGAEVEPEDLYTLGTEKDYTKTGWYTQLDFPFTLLLGETDLAKKFEFALMYSVLEGARTKDDNKHTFDRMSRLSPAISFSPDPALKFKLEYQLTMLGDYNDTASNVAKYGDDIDDLSRIQLSASMVF